MLMKSSIITGGLAIIAGSDTTSSAMSNFFYYLLTNPKTYKRVQDEIDELGDEVMNFGMQTQLSYLTAAMYVPHYSTPEIPSSNPWLLLRNEALRLLPPVLSGSQRATEVRSEPHAVGP